MTEVKHNNVKYPSTNQFRNVIQHITKAERFCGVDENNNAIYDSFKTLPAIPYIATVKLHGTNGSMIMFEDQTIYFQSKERLLSFGYDNAGFWEHMQRSDKTYLFDLVKEKYLETHQELKYPIIIAGEWAGCFSYGTPILLEDGSTLPIGKIVNQKLNVNVMSYNEETGKLEARRITNWFNNGSTENWIRITYKRRKRGGTACGITVTPNHTVYRKINNQMVESSAGELVAGDTIYIAGETLNHKMLQFISGSLLGDGSFTGKRHYCVAHSVKQEFYTRHIEKLLVGTICKGVSGAGSILDRFTSMAYPEVEDFYDELYSTTGASKEPTRKYLDKLGPIALAAWYMDDGSLIDQTKNGRQYACDLHTQGFSEESNNIIVNFLNDRGYECYKIHTKTKVNGEEGYSIRFTPRGCAAFLEDIAPYVLEGFNYKLPAPLRDLPKIDVFKSNSEYEQPLLETVISKVEKNYRPKILTKYDIEVEGNHNYFANNVLVHNSNIQKGVAVSELNKMFVVFGVKVGEDWQPQEEYSHIFNHAENIYNTLEFPHWSIEIDFNKPEIAQAQIVDLTLKVEQECPIGKHFGVSGIGEGIVLKPKDGKYCLNSGSWFKSKGEKHSSSKVKKLAAVDTEKLANIQEFIDYTVTESRLNQMMVEVKPETLSQIGECIKWMKSDILKEESDTMVDNNLEMKDCGHYIAQKVKDFVIKSLS